MPSKKKKHSKTPLKLSYSDQSTPSHVLSSASSPFSEPEISEEDLCHSLLEEASIKYPSLISTSAFVGRIADVESNSGYAATIWLSESAMVASSIAHGSIVSVSLAASRKKLLSGSPLDSLTDECARHDAIDEFDERASAAGNYFALAMACHSCKVLKNDVRLSWSLSSTMGNPSFGKITFISPIQTHSIDGLLNGIDKLHTATDNSVSHLSLCYCKDLYLELVPSKNGLRINEDMSSPVNSTSVTHHDQFENGKASSPKTPLVYQSKLNSSGASLPLLRKCQESVSTVRHSNGTLFDTYDIGEALVDKKSKEVFQICAALWLHSRFLLHGNLVAIPRSGQAFVFRVVDANKLSIECHSKDLIHEVQTLDADHVDLAFVIDHKTKLHLNSLPPLETQIPVERGLPPVELECRNIKDEASHVSKLGGLSKEFAILKEIIISSLVKHTLSSLGLRTTKGVLLHGPPGTGKTSLAHSCVNDAGVNLFSINGPEIISQFHGESEQALHEVFDSASQAAPAVVFIDELDAIAPSRKDGGEELSQRMVATLLNLMDGISRTDGVLVIAATNRPDSIDPALRRPGRLDREIEIGVPSPKQRLNILLTLLSEMDHSLVDSQIQNLASSTHGFVGADLAALCNEAAMVCLRRHVKLKNSATSSAVALDDGVQPKEPCVGYDDCSDDIMECSGLSNATKHMFSIDHVDSVSQSLSDLTVSPEIVQSFCSDAENQERISTPQNAVHFSSGKVASEPGEDTLLQITFEDFEKAKMKVRPSAMREVILEIPKVSWEDVGGQKEVKKQLIEAVEWPQKHQDAFKRIGTRPPTGVLMFGPPGCSKTLMARAVASEAGLNFLAVKGPELFSKWVGESEKAVRSLFAKARANAPAIIFFDEIDGLAITRGKENDGASVSDRVMSQLLVELDGLHQRVDVTVIAATNRPDKIDPALLRPGRFDRLLYVGPPDEADREDIFHIKLRKMPCSSDVIVKELAQLTKGCTGADISLICREAAIAAIEESLDASEISMAHFKIGLSRVQPSEVRSYQKFSAKFQRLVCSGATIDKVECHPISSSSSWITFWTKAKAHFSLFFRLPAAFSLSKAAS